MYKAVVLLAGMAFGVPTFAAAIESRVYSCAELHALIAAQGWVFISAATFGDNVVADQSICSAGEIVELRSVATRDTPECPVNYCTSRGGEHTRK